MTLPSSEVLPRRLRRLARGRRTVPVLMLVCVLIWGSGFSGARLLTDELGAGPLTAARTLVIALTLLACMPLMQPSGPIRRSGDWWRLALAGIVGISLYNLAIFGGLTHVTAGVGSIVVSTTPLLVALLARIHLEEPLDAGRATGLGVAFAGVVVLAVGGGELDVSYVSGLLFLLLAPLSWALYTIMTKSLGGRYNAVDLTHRAAWYAVVATLPWLVTDLGAFATLDLSSWLWLVYLGTIGGGVTVIIYAWGLQRWPAAGLASFVLLVPLAGVGWAWALLGEIPDRATVAGGALVLAGLAFVWRSRPVPFRLAPVVRAALRRPRST